VIKYGPPSSGKGYLEGLLAKSINVDSYIDVNVDKYVEYAFSHKDICEKCDSTSPITQDEYFYLRNKFASNMSDDVMYMALRKGQHVMWETTGNSVDWTINYVIPLVKKFNYQVVLMYPLVNLKNLVERCSKRAQAANCTEQYIGTIKRNADKNFAVLIKHIDTTFIYDNNYAKPVTVLTTLSNRTSTPKQCSIRPALEANVDIPITREFVHKKCVHNIRHTK
jgi:hypothetical protein